MKNIALAKKSLDCAAKALAALDSNEPLTNHLAGIFDNQGDENGNCTRAELLESYEVNLIAARSFIFGN